MLIAVLDDLAASPNSRFEPHAVKKALGLMANIFVFRLEFTPTMFAPLSLATTIICIDTQTL
jgi:hypothetical protein